MQVPYRYALELLQNASTELIYDHTTTAYWFDYICDQHTRNPDPTSKKVCTPGRHQVWIDTPASLSIKYEAMSALDLKGVFMWTAGSVDYSATDGQVRELP